MSDAEILMEYEACLAFDGELLKECPECGRETHRKNCPDCTDSDGEPLPISGDTGFDKALKRLESGEEIEDFDAFLKEEFEPVPRRG